MSNRIEIGSHHPVLIGASNSLTWNQKHIVVNVSEILEYNSEHYDDVIFPYTAVLGTHFSNNPAQVSVKVFNPEHEVLRNSYKVDHMLNMRIGNIKDSNYHNELMQQTGHVLGRERVLGMYLRESIKLLNVFNSTILSNIDEVRSKHNRLLLDGLCTSFLVNGMNNSRFNKSLIKFCENVV